MKKKVYILTTIFVLILVSVIGYIYLSQQEKNQPQIFELKIGEKKFYKGEFNLKLELIKIGKIKEIIDTSNFSDPNFFPYFDDGACIDKVCSNYPNYYVIKVENMDVDWECRQQEIYINTVSYYGCPDSYIFEINPLKSNDNKIEFKIEYAPVSFN